MEAVLQATIKSEACLLAFYVDIDFSGRDVGGFSVVKTAIVLPAVLLPSLPGHLSALETAGF